MPALKTVLERTPIVSARLAKALQSGPSQVPTILSKLASESSEEIEGIEEMLRTLQSEPYSSESSRIRRELSNQLRALRSR